MLLTNEHDLESFCCGNNEIDLNFSDGIWICNDWGNEDKYPEWELDTSASDRDDIIKEIKDYMEKNETAKNRV